MGMPACFASSMTLRRKPPSSNIVREWSLELARERCNFETAREPFNTGCSTGALRLGGFTRVGCFASTLPLGVRWRWSSELDDSGGGALPLGVRWRWSSELDGSGGGA